MGSRDRVLPVPGRARRGVWPRRRRGAPDRAPHPAPQRPAGGAGVRRAGRGGAHRRPGATRAGAQHDADRQADVADERRVVDPGRVRHVRRRRRGARGGAAPAARRRARPGCPRRRPARQRRLRLLRATTGRLHRRPALGHRDAPVARVAPRAAVPVRVVGLGRRVRAEPGHDGGVRDRAGARTGGRGRCVRTRRGPPARAPPRGGGPAAASRGTPTATTPPRAC